MSSTAVRMSLGASQKTARKPPRFHCLIIRYEVANLEWAMPVGNQFRVPYCNYSFVREQGHSRTVRQYDTPPRGPSCLHGVRAFQKSKFLRCRGNQHNRNSLVHISQTEWVLPSRVLRQSPLVLFVLLCVAPAPFFVASLSFFWRNANLAGRFAGRLCCWFLFLLGLAMIRLT